MIKDGGKSNIDFPPIKVIKLTKKLIWKINLSGWHNPCQGRSSWSSLNIHIESLLFNIARYMLELGDSLKKALLFTPHKHLFTTFSACSSDTSKMIPSISLCKLAYIHYSALFTNFTTAMCYQNGTCAQSTDEVRGFSLFGEMGNRYHQPNVK